MQINDVIVDNLCVICKNIPENSVNCPKCGISHCHDCCGDICSVYGCKTKLKPIAHEPITYEPKSLSNRVIEIPTFNYHVPIFLTCIFLIVIWSLTYFAIEEQKKLPQPQNIEVSGKLFGFDFKPEVVVYSTKNRSLTFSSKDGIRIGKGLIPYQSITIFFRNDNVSEIHCRCTTQDNDTMLGSYKRDEIKFIAISYHHGDTKGYVKLDLGREITINGNFDVVLSP